MNSIEALKRDLESTLPDVETKLRKPRNETGHWWLDASRDGHAVVIEWSPRRGFGINTDDPGDGYGEGPDEVYTDRAEVTRRVIELFANRGRSVPPREVVLRELRAALGFTQEQLADRLGVQQAAVSRLERRPDMTLSSLRRYVEALGGALEINVRTPEGEQVRLLDAPQRVRRATCEHVAATLAGEYGASHSLSSSSAELLGQLEREARQRWELVAPDALRFEERPGELASAEPEQGRVALSAALVSTLQRRLASNSCDAFRPPSWTTRELYRYLLGHEVGHFVREDSLRLGPTSKSVIDPELRADAVAGWLAAAVGDEPSTGAVVASWLGCRIPRCTHPTPEQRMFAFLSGHAHGLRDESRTPRVSMLVLRVADLDASRAFYSTLGLGLVAERHGQGPLHYSCSTRSVLLELYPCTDASPRPHGLRFGLVAQRHAFEQLRDSGLLRQPPRLIRSRPSAEVYLVRDPDENSIELAIAA